MDMATMNSTKKTMTSSKYKKRPGTSGISGQLYETKLISLILFKLHNDKDIEDFSLASNVDDVGAFDDICLKVKRVGNDRPLFVFIQAKHKEDDDTFLNYELFRHFYISHVKVKQQFYNSTDDFFKEKLDNSDNVFILYTNAKYCGDSVEEQTNLNVPQIRQARITYVSDFADKLNYLVGTGEVGSQAQYSDEDLDFVNDIIIEEEIIAIAEHLAKFLDDKTKQSMNIMLDDYILQYHVILANTILNISKIQIDEKQLQWRELTFNEAFFNSDEKIMKLLRKSICAQIFKTQITAQVTKKKDKKGKKAKPKDGGANDEAISKLITLFLTEPTAVTLSPLIGTEIIYKLDKLHFTSDRSSNEVQTLEETNLSLSTIEEAEEIAAKKILKPLKLKVPVTFGNLDITIGGNEKKIDKRLRILSEFIEDLCVCSVSNGSYNIVLDESVGEGFLSLNGGIGSAIGSLLIHDKSTRLLKFTENSSSLPNNAKILFTSLISVIGNLDLYRFDVKALVKFPKLVFDYKDEAKMILKNVVIYEKQGNHKVIGDKLKNEIEIHHLTNHHHIPVTAETISVYYHHEIQLWWMSLKFGTCLTKSEDKTYQQALNNIVTEPQLGSMQTTFYMTHLNYFRYKFSDHTTNSLILLNEHTRTIISTDIIMLSTIKVIQCLREKYNTKNLIIDLDYMLNLKENEFVALNSELTKTNKVLIVVCNKIDNNRIFHRRLDEISKATERKKMVVVANKAFIETVQQYFPSSDVVNDDKQSLCSLMKESQKEIIDSARIVFQGQEISFDLIIDNETVKYVKGAIFNKIVCNETITIGKSLTNMSYEEIKPLYVSRRVSRDQNNDLLSSDDNDYEDNVLIETFNDIKDNTVLITAKPGMGKSTLLTHLSLKTKEHDMENKKLRWIERINLLDHSKVFHNWQKDNVEINTLETLKFVCQTILKNSLIDHSKIFIDWHKDVADIDTLGTLKVICQAILRNNNILINLEERGNKVYLKECTGDEWATFELDMFLHFYNERKLIFVFDGFDEICPHYKDTVIKLFNVVKHYRQQNKMWVTSRPHSEILTDLEQVLNKCYEIEFIDDKEQENYLNKSWDIRNLKSNFSDEQFVRIFAHPDEFLGLMPSMLSLDTVYINLQKIYYHLRQYLYSNLSNTAQDKISQFNNILHSSEVIIPEELTEYDGSPYLEKNPKKPEKKGNKKNKLNKFLGTPLLLYLLVDYFVNLINDINSNIFKGNINVFIIYKQFIETKLKKILFQDKLKMDVYMPGIITRYEQDLIDCINMHKKLAAHVIFKNSFLNNECRLFEFENMRPFNESDTTHFESMVSKFKSGNERTGLITHVTPDNTPVFIHKTFAEYFAAEYVSDILKSNKFDTDTKKLLFTTIYLLNTNDVLPWLCRKREFDSELKAAITSDFLSILMFTTNKLLINNRMWSIEQFVRLMSSSREDYYENRPIVLNLTEYRNMNRDEKELSFIKVQEDLLMRMKPNIKKHFTSPLWPMNTAANCSARYPSTPIRRHLIKSIQNGTPFPFYSWFED